MEEGENKRVQTRAGVFTVGNQGKTALQVRCCRCGEKICSAGVPLFRAQRHSASGHNVSKRLGCGQGVE